MMTILPHPSLPIHRTLRIYLQHTLAHRREAAWALALPLSNIALGVMTPYFASKMLASILAHSSETWHYFSMFVASAAVGILLDIVGIRNSMTLQAKTMESLHNAMFSHLLQRSVGFYNNQIGGKLVSDALDFVTAYGTIFGAGYIGAGSFIVTTIVGLVLIALNNWLIGLALLVLLGSLIWWTIVETHKRSSLRAERQKLTKQLTGHLSDVLVNAVTVKTFAQEEREQAASYTLSHRLATVRGKDWRRAVSSEGERMGVLLLIQAILLVLLIHLTAHSPHLLGTSIFAFTYTLAIINRFFTINPTVRQLEDAFLQASPMVELLGEPVEVQDAPHAKPLRITAGKIVCRKVSFHYEDAQSKENIFTKLNLVIQPGEKVGLVGHSGGGKSTLTRLLLRFEDIQDGTIIIDQQDIREVTQASLRQAISYVPQEPLLFHRTVRENIMYGRSDATEQDIEAAARLAYAHDFITKLPEGYDTLVGERGVKLSGGQRQRIAIARAILKNAPILILDEATSALDSTSEKVIQKALWKLMEGKTAVVIAHRLSTIQKMDRIVVMDNGKIIEDGTHQQLLERGGVYAKLWAHQSGGFIEE